MKPKSNGLFSIIIPTLNEGELLHTTVESILQETSYPDYEIIIVDDGSTDGSCDRFKRSSSPIEVISSGGLGCARAKNLGAQHATGDYLAFIDAHCRVSPNWLDGFKRSLNPPDVCIVGPAFTKLWEPQPRGCGMTWIDDTLETGWFEPLDLDEPYEVPLTTGACQAFRRNTFAAVGRFDDGFTRWGFEDVELCLRAWILGYRVLGDPTITVAHHFRESRNYEVDDKEIAYNFLRMVYMHFSAKRIRRVLKAVSLNPYIGQALDELHSSSSDVFELRAELARVRGRDDDWFFNVFAPTLLRDA